MIKTIRSISPIGGMGTQDPVVCPPDPERVEIQVITLIPQWQIL